ncbi:MAG: 1-acyl-sn-glycerol-3-phosphate acyltransferase [Spirochaetaceae bacterium]|nr:1-acyl-sn-glycerol-3-phosphate acyltransferase [Spirochaetaceae bacterium]
MDESRYAEIVNASRIPAFGMIKESAKEDRTLRLARIFASGYSTVLRIPYSKLMIDGPGKERYVFKLLQDWCKSICRQSRMKLKVTGQELVNPSRSYLFVVNHISPLDIAVMYATLPINATVVADSLFSCLPILSYWMRLTCSVFVERGNAINEFVAFKEMIRQLKKGRSLVLFPEGFLNKEKGLAEFKRGGIHAALIAHVPIIPVCLGGVNEVLASGSLTIIPGRPVSVQFGEPVDGDLLDEDSKKHIETVIRDRIATMQV